MFTEGLGIHPLDPGGRTGRVCYPLWQGRKLGRAQLGLWAVCPSSREPKAANRAGNVALLGRCDTQVQGGSTQGTKGSTRTRTQLSGSHLAGACRAPAVGETGTVLVLSTGPLRGQCPRNACTEAGPQLKTLVCSGSAPSCSPSI